MSLPSFLKLLRGRWELVAMSTLLGVIIAMTFALLTTPMFVATSEIFLSTPRFNNATSANTSPYQSDGFTQQRARSYVQLATREDLARRVIAKLGLNMSPESLASATSASVRPDTVLIDISVKSSSAAEAKVLTDAMTSELSKDIGTLESRAGLGVPVVEPIVTQAAETPRKPSEPNIAIYLLYGASSGFLLGITAASLREGRRLDAKLVAQFTARPVLGRIVISDAVNADGLVEGEQGKFDRLRMQWKVIQANVSSELFHSHDRVIAVTTEIGSTQGSPTAARLALEMATSGLRVLLVLPQLPLHGSHDNRKNILLDTRQLSTDGLTEVIEGDAPPHDTVRSTTVENLFYLSSPDSKALARLSRSGKFGDTLKTLRSSFDLVVVDVNDYLRTKQYTLISDAVDSVILVISEANIRKRRLTSAMEDMGSHHVRLMGSILISGTAKQSLQHDLATVVLPGERN